MVLQRKKTALLFVWQSRCHPCLPLHMACINQTMMSWRSVASSVRWFLARWWDWEWASFRPSYRQAQAWHISGDVFNEGYTMVYCWPHPVPHLPVILSVGERTPHGTWIDWSTSWWSGCIWLQLAASLPISDIYHWNLRISDISGGLLNHVQPSFPWWSRPFCMSGSTTNQYSPWLLARFLQKIPGKHPNFIQFLLHHIPLLKRIITRLDIRRRTSNIAISKGNCTSA